MLFVIAIWHDPNPIMENHQQLKEFSDIKHEGRDGLHKSEELLSALAEMNT